jgi:endo-1,3-1,4-beta-glycanase ExoK
MGTPRRTKHIIATATTVSLSVAALAFAGTPAAGAQDNLIENGDFSAGLDSWETLGDIEPEVIDGQLCVDVPGGAEESHELMILQRGLPLVEGEHYTWTFTASADRSLYSHVAVRTAAAPAAADLTRRPQLDTTPTTFEYVFTAGNTTDSGEVRFAVGGHPEPWTYCVDDISLVGGAQAPGPDPGGESFYEDFANGIDRVFWFINHGYRNGGHQECMFNEDNLTVEDGLLVLTLDDTPFDELDYSCAAMQTRSRYGYGTYETVMRVSEASGTNQSLFTYIGPPQGQPWHEIDVEVLGKDTTKVEPNTWVNGVPSGGGPIDLGVDNSEEFVHYAFAWEPHQVRFFVNGELIRTYSEPSQVPDIYQQIFVMTWNTATLTDWMGPFEYDGVPITTEYEYVAFTRAGEECQFEGSMACDLDLEPPTISFVDEFDTLNTSRWMVSNGWNNGPQQNCTWASGMVQVADGTLNMTFAEQATGDRDYACAEIQHRGKLGYGTYEARIRGVDASGVMGSFFTWVGASGGQPSEAIDIAKLLGTDTSRVKINTWRNGISLHPTLLALPVPADEDFIDYGVVWTPDRMDFYVNGVRRHSITNAAHIPDREANLFLNIWGSETNAEMGEFVPPDGPLTMQVERVAYTAPGDACQFPESIACES